MANDYVTLATRLEQVVVVSTVHGLPKALRAAEGEVVALMLVCIKCTITAVLLLTALC